MPLLAVKNLCYAYEDGSEVLQGLNFVLEQGSITAVVGLSGCGKSTLCQCLCGIIPQALGGCLRGQILLHGKTITGIPLARLATQIGLVMQNPDHQLVTTTVEDELAFAPENLCLPPADIQKRVRETLALLGLEALRLQNPSRLSGGQKQLVAIASVLTLQPQVLVLDEAMSHLDAAGKSMVRQALLTLNRNGKTIIFVEHDLQAATFAEKWLVMREGSIVKEGMPAQIWGDKAFLYEQNLY